MILRVFAVYDSKTEAYLPPFYAPTRGVALRMFTEASQDQSSAIGKYPSDFTLFELGAFDDGSAIFSMHDSKVPLGTALELRAHIQSS